MKKKIIFGLVLGVFSLSANASPMEKCAATYMVASGLEGEINGKPVNKAEVEGHAKNMYSLLIKIHGKSEAYSMVMSEVSKLQKFKDTDRVYRAKIAENDKKCGGLLQ